MERLISTTNRIISLLDKDITREEFEQKSIAHATFMLQKIELWMFVPCKLVGGVWVVLEKPMQYNSFIDYENDMDEMLPLIVLHNCKVYKEAKDRVLFEGLTFEDESDNFWYFGNGITVITPEKFLIIEDLVKYNLELTPTAQKQIGL